MTREPLGWANKVGPTLAFPAIGLGALNSITLKSGPMAAVAFVAMVVGLLLMGVGLLVEIWRE